MLGGLVSNEPSQGAVADNNFLRCLTVKVHWAHWIDVTWGLTAGIRPKLGLESNLRIVNSIIILMSDASAEMAGTGDR